MRIIIKRGRRISLLFYFAHNCAHLRTISHHFLHIKLYDVIGKSIVFIQSVPRFIRGAFFNTKLKRVDIVGFNYKQQYAVVVMCKDESEQEAVYNRLKAEGLKLKVVAV